MLDRCAALSADVLERHGGTVEHVTGDAAVGIFGLPSVHEDDALRAVRAALELREAVAALGVEIERDHGVRIAARSASSRARCSSVPARGASRSRRETP